MKNLIIVFAILFSFNIKSQTVGLFKNDTNSFDGATLIAPIFSNGDFRTYLIDNCGIKIHEWPTTVAPGNEAYMLQNGNLFRTLQMANPIFPRGGIGGGAEIIGWDGNKLWEYKISDSTEAHHHDAYYMPNGNILFLIWDRKDSSESIANGRDPSQLPSKCIWSEKLVEIKPIGSDSGEIVWEWDSWDHMIQNFDNSKLNYGQPKDHPELWDVNYLGWSAGDQDWLHANAVSYNASLDQITLSFRTMHEIYIIDHSTTTAEAKGHTGGARGKGGDILYRWGNPEAYGRGTVANQKLYAQHNIHWIDQGLVDEGKMMVFNNGETRSGGDYSSVDIFAPITDINGDYILKADSTFGPDSAEWSYTTPVKTDFFAKYISSAERLPNGNTLIDDGTHGTVFEIAPNDSIVWKYVNPVSNNGILSQGNVIAPFAAHGTNNWLFRVHRYPYDYAGFAGKTFNTTVPIELNPSASTCVLGIENSTLVKDEISVYPNPSINSITLKTKLGITGKLNVSITNLLGKTLAKKTINSGEELDISNLPAGLYIIIINDHFPVKFTKL